MSFIVVAYHTNDSLYTAHAKRLKVSLERLHLRYFVSSIRELGSWQRNTQFKPKFILDCLRRFHPASVVYTDVDSEFLRYPTLFDKLNEVVVAAHLLDHSKFRRKNQPSELLSGTLYFGNKEAAYQIIDAWIKECERTPDVWDQVALHKIVGDNFFHLPPEYCAIFDYMSSVKDPVIVHYQASREARRNNLRIGGS